MTDKKLKIYLYNAVDYMIQAGESEKYIADYIGIDQKELTKLLDNFEEF